MTDTRAGAGRKTAAPCLLSASVVGGRGRAGYDTSVDDDVYRHAHRHNQQPGNEWNDRVRSGVGGSNSGGSGWEPASGGGAPNTGAPDGSGYLVLWLIGLVVVIPAAAMALLATPILKPLAPSLGGRFTSYRWRQTLWTTLFGSMWYLGLTLVAAVCLAAYGAYGLSGGPFNALALWEQWLASAWWSTRQVINWTGHMWSGGEAAMAVEWPPGPAPWMVVATAGALPHLPGVAAYAFILRRAGYVDEGWGGFALGLGVATALVLVTAPLATWLGGMAFRMLQS
jgi:hypothetical protein